jgi:hypothetical protein
MELSVHHSKPNMKTRSPALDSGEIETASIEDGSSTFRTSNGYWNSYENCH